MTDPIIGTNQCNHGNLRRSCEVCELQARLAECKRAKDDHFMNSCLRANIEVLAAENDTLRAELAALREACSELIVDGCSYGDDCTPEAMRKHYKCWTCQLRDALGR